MEFPTFRKENPTQGASTTNCAHPQTRRLRDKEILGSKTLLMKRAGSPKMFLWDITTVSDVSSWNSRNAAQKGAKELMFLDAKLARNTSEKSMYNTCNSGLLRNFAYEERITGCMAT
jgi:hypothetical protein